MPSNNATVSTINGSTIPETRVAEAPRNRPESSLAITLKTAIGSRITDHWGKTDARATLHSSSNLKEEAKIEFWTESFRWKTFLLLASHAIQTRVIPQVPLSLRPMHSSVGKNVSITAHGDFLDTGLSWAHHHHRVKKRTFLDKVQKRFIISLTYRECNRTINTLSHQTSAKRNHIMACAPMPNFDFIRLPINKNRSRLTHLLEFKFYHANNVMRHANSTKQAYIELWLPK